MLRICLCGGSGSGKGYISKMISDLGFPCLDTDALVHRLYQNDRELIASLGELFGPSVISPDGSVDRAALRDIVFSSKETLSALNKTVHQRVCQYCLLYMDEHERMGATAAFIDAPQVFEAGMDKYFDHIIAVVCPIEQRIARIISRDGITREQAERRIANQLDDEEYIKRSHTVIYNLDENNTKQQLLNFLQEVDLID